MTSHPLSLTALKSTATLFRLMPSLADTSSIACLPSKCLSNIGQLSRSSLPVIPPKPPSACFGGLGFADIIAVSSKVWAILSSHLASIDDAFCGERMVVWVNKAGSGSVSFSMGDVGETIELWDGDGDGEAGLRCSGDGRWGFASRSPR